MSISIEQYRSAIGNFHNFTESKYMYYLIKLIRMVLLLYKFFDSIFLKMMFNISYKLFVISLLLLLAGNVKPNPGPVTFCHLNARSLLAGVDLETHISSQYSLLDEIYETLVYDFDFDLIAVSETWLKDNIGDDDISLAGYQVPFYRHRQTRGGGVMLYVKEGISAVHKKELENDNIEIMWVELKILNRLIYFGVCYRPPGMSALEVDDFLSDFGQIMDAVMDKNPDMIVCVGDFNDKCMIWDGDHSDSELGLKLYNYVNDNNLFQVIDEPTRYTDNCASLLDLILTDSPGYLDDIGTLPPIGLSPSRFYTRPPTLSGVCK